MSYLHNIGEYNVSSGWKNRFDVGKAASPVQSNMAAMIAEQFVQLQLKIMKKLKNAIFRLV